jgi:cellulose synthase operon protein C
MPGSSWSRRSRPTPPLVPALVLRARSMLSGEDFDAAERDVDLALEVNPNSSEALAVLAAARLLEGDRNGFEDIRDRVLSVNPRNADFFVDVAELVSRGRFYAEAAELAGTGVQLDSLAWNAYGTLGLNQLRIGAMSEGRENVERAFEGDPYNIWFKNTLDLLDVMDGFETWETDRIQVFVDPEDGEALAIYLLEMAERSYTELSDRYRTAPAPPIRVEVFRRSADFSVRTMGLTGLGALGVAFGNVLAMDSPAARGAGGFHWASTLWHEIAHAFHLAMTDHRVPRWFSEGLAVHEERLAGPGWGMRPSLTFLAAWSQGRLRKPSELSQSFVRPRFPEEVGYSYVLSSLVMEWIEEEWGSDGTLDMLDAYREGLTPDEVIERRLGIALGDFDDRFEEWMHTRYADALAAADAAVELRGTPDQARTGDREWLSGRVSRSPHDVESRIALGAILLDEGDLEEARIVLEEARDIFPGNPDPRGANRILAELHRRAGDGDAEIEALSRHVANVSTDYDSHLELARLLEERGDLERAARSLEEALNVYPYEIAVHERLARVYRELGEGSGEVRERRVILALNPVDRAGALHGLADAQYRAGDLEGARVTVLRALEVAPRFPEAQDLLLRILEGEND